MPGQTCPVAELQLKTWSYNTCSIRWHDELEINKFCHKSILFLQWLFICTWQIYNNKIPQQQHQFLVYGPYPYSCKCYHNIIIEWHLWWHICIIFSLNCKGIDYFQQLCWYYVVNTYKTNNKGKVNIVKVTQCQY